MKPNLNVEYRPVGGLVPYTRNARTHSKEQIAQIAASITAFGWTNPILVDGENGVIAGHVRLLAAKKLGLIEVPVIELAGMREAQKRAYIIADNQLALNAGWDFDTLAIELGDLAGLDFELSLTGFGDEELASINDLPGLEDEDEDEDEDGDEVAVRTKQTQPVSRTGDVWLLGQHRLICGEPTGEDDVIGLDRAIESWQARAETPARLEANGRSFAETKKDRGQTIGASPARRRRESYEGIWVTTA